MNFEKSISTQIYMEKWTLIYIGLGTALFYNYILNLF